MERIVEKALRPFTVVWRALVLTLVICATGGAWAEYVAGWDFKGLAKSQWSTSTGTAIALEGSAPHIWTSMPENEKVFTVDFTIDALPEAAGTIASWKMANNTEIAFVKSATESGSATLRLAWGYWTGGSAGNNYSSTADYSWTADASSHAFRIEYDHSNVTGKIRGTRVFMDGIKICDASGYRFYDSAVQGLVLGGCSGSKGQETWPNSTATFSNVTYSSGTSLQDDATLTSNGYTLKLNGCILNADGSVSIVGTNGLSVEFADGDGFYNAKEITAVVEMSSLPTSGTVIDYLQGEATGNGGRHVGLSIKNASTLAQSWGGAGDATSWNQGYNDVTCATLGGKHTVAFAYNGAWGGGQTFVDGSAGCNNYDGLYDSSHNLRKLYVGSLNGTSVAALGMRVYSIKLYTTKLDASGAAAAASDVILSDGCTAAFSSGATYKYCGSGFTNGFTIDLAGQTVALGTYPGTSGTITINDSVGGGSATMTLPEGFTGSFAGTGTLAVTAPASILPVSGGMDLSSATITIPDASGTVIASDSVTVGNSGIQVALASTIENNTVMVKASNIPSTSCRLIGWMTGQYQSKDIENCAYYDGSNFNQCYYLGGTWQNDYNSSGDSRSWTRDALDHWIEISYARGSGTFTYLDGSQKVSSTGLRWGSNSTSKITIGGTATSSTSPATGMVIKEVVVISNGLSESQMSKVTTALNNGWTVNAAGTTLTSDTLVALPDSDAVKVKGTLSIASDGTYSFTSLDTVEVLAGGTLNVGTLRPTVAGVAETGTLAISTEVVDPTISERITGYSRIASITVTGDISGTVTLNGEAVTPTVVDGTATVTKTVAGNATYTGSGWWWDYEFTGNGNNIGSEGTGMQWDDPRPFQGSEYTTADESGNQMLHLPSRPWRNVSGGYPSEFTAVMYCKAGATANGVLVAFGSTYYSGKTITLSTGSDPSAGQMRLVYGTGQSSSTDLVKGGFTLDNITSANHLYAFTVQTVDDVSQIKVYADGDLQATYTADSVISLGTGFQIASGHGGVPNGLSRLADDDVATMDFLRVSNVALSEAAIKALAAEYRYVSPNGIAERAFSADSTWTDESNTSWSQMTLNQDGSNTRTSQAAPNNGTVVEVTASTDVTLTLDLASEVSYEKVVFQGDGAITVRAGGTAPTVTTRTYIDTDVTIELGAFASLGAVTVANGKTLTIAPDYSAYYATTLNTGIGLGIRGSTSTTVTGTATLGTDAHIVLPAAMVSDLATYGITLTLTPDASGRYLYTISRDDNPVHIIKDTGGRVHYYMYPADIPFGYDNWMTLPEEPATIPEDFAASVDIVNRNASNPLEIATVFEGGTVPVTVSKYGDLETPVIFTGDSTFGGTVTLNAPATFAGDITLAGTVSGSAVLTVTGSITVGAGASIPNLGLADGAAIVFPTSSSTLTGITSLTFASGTTYISFPNGAPDAETTIIDWTSVGTAPDGDFVLADDLADTHILTKGDTGLTIKKGVASVRTTSGVTHYNAVALAVAAAAGVGEDLQYITICNSGAVNVGYFAKEIKIKNYGGATITIRNVPGDISLSDPSTVDGITTYTATDVPSSYTWTDGSPDSHNWSNIYNWIITGSTTGSRYPQAGDTVIFNNGATVTLNESATVAGITVNGEVSISGTAVSLNTSGNITGEGTLTLSDVCLASADAGITVAPAVNFTNDSELAGANALTLNGAVVISDTFKVWNSSHVINGNVTINSGVTFKYGALLLINGAATVKGAFTRDAGSSSCIKFCGVVTIENGNVSIDGWQSGNLDDAATVVLAGATATLTDSRGSPIDLGKVTTSLYNRYVNKVGNIYSVVKPGTIFSVY